MLNLKVMPIFGLDNAYLNLVILFMGILWLLLVSFTYVDSNKETEYLEQYSSSELTISGAILLVTIIPTIVDINDTLISKQSVKLKQCLFGRLLCSTAILIMGCQIVVKTVFFKLFDSYVSSFYFSLFLLSMSFTASTMFTLCVLKPAVFTVWRTSVLTALMCASANLSFRSFHVGFVCFEYDMLRIAVFICTGLTYMISFIQWTIKLWEETNVRTIDHYVCLLYLYSFILTTTLLCIHQLVYLLYRIFYIDLFSSSTIKYIEILNVIFPVYVFVLSLIIVKMVYSRIALMDMVHISKVMETKQIYVRYISHELLTPLNSVHLGLQLCVDQILENTSNENEKERRETIIEVGLACEVTREILNELQLYGEIEDGLVSLNKSQVNILDFITNSLAMFTVQLRVKHIQLKFMNHDSIIQMLNTLEATSNRNHSNSVSSSSHSFSRKFSSCSIVDLNRFSCTEPLTDSTDDDVPMISSSDEIDIDKSKLGQVLRNLMSNAIKFTPDNGDIKLTIKFESNNNKYTTKTMLRTQLSNKPSASASASPSVGTPSKLLSMKERKGKSSNKSFAFKDPIQSASNKFDSKYEFNDNLEETKGMLVVEIQDNGAGISTENQFELIKKMFEFDVKDLVPGGGCGLGLWVSNAIVELHEGKISVYSQGEGKGTMFRVETPMIRKKALLSTTAVNTPCSATTVAQSLFPSSSSLNSYAASVSSTSKNQNISFDDDYSHYESETDDDDQNHKIYGEDVIVNMELASESNGNILIENCETSQITDLNDMSAKLPTANDSFENDSKIIEFDIPNLIPTTDIKNNNKDDDCCNYLGKLVLNATSITTSTQMKLLTVDDSRTNTKFLRKLLENRGHYVEEAIDGSVAVSKIINSEIDFDVIFMDYVMPKMNGLEASTAIRELGYTGLIIGLTGNTLETDKIAFLKAGANYVLTKPLKMEELLKIIVL